MPRRHPKDELVDFLEERAFRPVLDAPPDRYHDGDRDRLRRAQKTVREQMTRLRGTATISEVIDGYRGDIRSDRGRETERTLHRLGLPAPADSEEGFRLKVRELGYDY